MSAAARAEGATRWPAASSSSRGLELFQDLGADRLDLGDDDVGRVAGNGATKSFGIEHREDVGFVCDLHGRRLGVAVAGGDMGAEAFGRDGELAAELAGAEQQQAGSEGHAPGLQATWRSMPSQ